MQPEFSGSSKTRSSRTAGIPATCGVPCGNAVARSCESTDFDFLVAVADELFTGAVLEEKVAAVFLLEKMDAQFCDREFRMFESWLDRISSWADHDGLVHYLIAPMVAAKPARVKSVFRWAKSPKRWHRRAACVSLIQATRKKQFFPQIKKLSNALLADQDDMVQKGLGLAAS